MAAAVADYTPTGGQIKGKMKRDQSLAIGCTATEDIVANLAINSRDDQLIIAFALEEAENLEQSARAKLERKKVDAIIANPLETMNASTIQATVFLRDGSTLSPESECSKSEFARWLIENIEVIERTTSSTS